jgi:hypothetical protein
LLKVGHRADSSLLEEFQRSPEECLAVTDEWRAFEAYISSLDAVQVARIEPLPYRRVLAKSESEHLRQELSTRWGGYWYPLAKCDPHTNAVGFHQEFWKKRDCTSLLHQATHERAVEGCILLLEGIVDYEIARSLVDPMHRGDESFVTSDFEWLLDSSHESSNCCCRMVADFFWPQWRDWEAVADGGPFHTDDLRGNWGMLKR